MGDWPAAASPAPRGTGGATRGFRLQWPRRGGEAKLRIRTPPGPAAPGSAPASPDFTRSSTDLCPSALAAAKASATSPGRVTGLPPASRMTSPACRPRSAATLSGSTSATATPSSAARALQAQAELGEGRRFLGLGGRLGVRLLVLRHGAERHGDGLLRAVAPDREIGGLLRPERGDAAREFLADRRRRRR